MSPFSRPHVDFFSNNIYPLMSALFFTPSQQYRKNARVSKRDSCGKTFRYAYLFHFFCVTCVHIHVILYRQLHLGFSVCTHNCAHNSRSR